MLKRTLEVKGVSVQSARDAFRMGALNGYITDPELWFDFLSKRNMTSHVYDEDIMEEVLTIFNSFSQEMSLLINALRTTK